MRKDVPGTNTLSIPASPCRRSSRTSALALIVAGVSAFLASCLPTIPAPVTATPIAPPLPLQTTATLELMVPTSSPLPSVVFSSTRADPDPDGCMPDCLLELFMLDPNSNEIVQLTTFATKSDDPDWSPQKDEIVFSSLQADNENLFILTLDSKQVRQITDDP